MKDIRQSVINQALDLEQFRAWLNAKPDREVVGRYRSPNSCPLARYVEEQTGCDYITINYDEVWVNGEVVPAPRWARQFTMAFDQAGKVDRNGTAKTARRCLPPRP